MIINGVIRKPMPFMPEMAARLNDGTKTQTRRPVEWKWLENVNPNFTGYSLGEYFTGRPETGYVLRSRGAYGCWNDRTKPALPPHPVGSQVWVKETWGIGTRPDPEEGWVDGIEYRADVEIANETDNDLHLYQIPQEAGDYSRYEGKGWRPSMLMPYWACRQVYEVTKVRVERVQDISEDDTLAEGFESREAFISYMAKQYPAIAWVWVYDLRRVEK